MLMRYFLLILLGSLLVSMSYPTTASPQQGVFAKVGDSITAAEWFLYPIGNGGFHPEGYGNLLPVVEHFTQETFNSFNHHSAAATPGWTSSDLLTPDMRNSSPNSAGCEAGETPLACEYRLIQPSVALIMIGTNDVLRGFDKETFQNNLREILRVTREFNVQPILSTIPDIRLGNPEMEGKVYEFNAIIFALGNEYGALIWDYWAALQDLPNLGLSGDGVHPSAPANGETGVMTAENLKHGYTIRNLTALNMLNIAMQQGY